MNPAAHDCRPADLPRLLQEQLTPEETEQLSQHLSGCMNCQQQLETLAGADIWWSDASQFLQPLNDTAAPVSSPRSAATTGEPPDDEDDGWQAIVEETFLADFAIHYLEPAENPALLGLLGEYEILELIGRGGMGVVFKGFDRELNRYVAVKVMAPHLALNPAARKRFGREAQAAAAVVHPHVIAIHSVNGAGRLPYFVMPYVAGESLQQRIDRTGPFDVKEVLRISMQAARGLAAAHEQGLVHRDIKPGNILLERGVDRILLTDFGLARTVDDATLTRSGMIAGTPQYMSPEQAKGDAVEPRSDLFSLGSVMYAMCTGHPPFRAETTMGVLRRITDTTPRLVHESNPEIPGWCAGIIDKLLRKSPSDRFARASDLSELLGQCLAHVQQPNLIPLPAEAHQLTPVYPTAVDATPPTTRNSARRKISRWILSLALLVACLLASLSPWGSPTPARQMTQQTPLIEVKLQEGAKVDLPHSTARLPTARLLTAPQPTAHFERPIPQATPQQAGRVAQTPPVRTMGPPTVVQPQPFVPPLATSFEDLPVPEWNDELPSEFEALHTELQQLEADLSRE